MSRILGVLFTVVFPVSCLLGQSEKNFRIEKSGEFENVFFNFSATSGTCYIRPTNNPYPVSIYGKTHDGIEPTMKERQENRDLSVWADMSGGVQNNLLARTISYKMLKSSEEPENLWKVYLSKDYNFNLNLNYAIGEAYIDLTQMSVSSLKINTGSADVKVSYQEGRSNKVEMDTFRVKVDLGTLKIDKVDHARAKDIIAEVGFGNLSLHFSEKCQQSSNIRASVGAGSLEVFLPDTKMGVIIHIRNSPLCHVKLAKNYHEIQPYVYVNEHYVEDMQEMLSFDIDVAMGSIAFK
jgi:hypothetical protein